MDQQHTINMDDIREFLASIDLDHSCGIPGSPLNCLVEKALEHKYPGEQFHVNSAYGYARTPGKSQEDFEFDYDVMQTIRTFDTLGSDTLVTRQMVEEAIPQLKA